MSADTPGRQLALDSLLRGPAQFFRTYADILTRPASFSTTRIDTDDRSLRAALFFFANAFVLIFAANELAARMNSYAGESRTATALILIPQFAAAIPLLYIANTFARHRPTLSGITQAALYVDAVFLSLLAVVSICALLPHYVANFQTSDVDLVATEYERCVANKSVVYWLTRGNLTFYHEHYSTPLAEQLREGVYYAQFVLALPFCLMFGRMMKARYAASGALNGAAAAIVFTAVVLGTHTAIDHWWTYAATQSDCWTKTGQTLRAQYSKVHLAAVAARDMNSTINKNIQRRMELALPHNEKIIFGIKLPDSPNGYATGKEAEILSRSIHMQYCAGIGMFEIPRLLEVPLHLIVHVEDATPLQAPIFQSQDCNGSNIASR